MFYIYTHICVHIVYIYIYIERDSCMYVSPLGAEYQAWSKHKESLSGII